MRTSTSPTSWGTSGMPKVDQNNAARVWFQFSCVMAPSTATDWCQHPQLKSKKAHDIICHHNKQLLAGNHPTPFHMIICGTAGTGKSYLISTIAHTLGTSCLLTATTGIAAFNICGQTLHSALQLPIHSPCFRVLHFIDCSWQWKTYRTSL